MRIRKRTGVVVAVAAALAFTTGAFVLNSDNDRDPLIQAQGQNLLPSETLQDWVTYGDHLVVVTLESAQELPASAEDIQAGEGFVPRVTTFRIDDILWSRAGAPAAPQSIQLDLDGWSFKGDEMIPIRVEGQPVLDEIGASYVMPIVYLYETPSVGVAGWSNLSPDSILPVEGSVVGRGDRIVGGERQTVATRAVWGKRASELPGVLRGQAPDPAAKPYMSEPADIRFNHAFESSHKLAPPAKDEK